MNKKINIYNVLPNDHLVDFMGETHTVQKVSLFSRIKREGHPYTITFEIVYLYGDHGSLTPYSMDWFVKEQYRFQETLFGNELVLIAKNPSAWKELEFDEYEDLSEDWSDQDE